MGTIPLLERQARITGCGALRRRLVEGPIASRETVLLAHIGTVHAGWARNGVPTKVRTQRRLEQHGGNAAAVVVAVGIHCRRIDRKHLLDGRRINGWNTRLLVIVYARPEVIDKRRPTILPAKGHARNVRKSLSRLGG